MERAAQDTKRTVVREQDAVKRIDLHCHSDHSRDSSVSLDVLIRVCYERGLSGCAVTDHNTVSGHADLKELAAAHPDLILIPGCEVSSTDGHILALGVSEAPVKHRPLLETIEQIRELGGIPIIAHPFRRGNGASGDDVRTAPDDVAVEGINGRSPQFYNQRVMHLCQSIGRCLTGGSDSHNIIGIGTAWTEFPADVHTVEEALDALRRGAVSPGGTGLTIVGQVYSKLLGIFRRIWKVIRAYIVDKVQRRILVKVER